MLRVKALINLKNAIRLAEADLGLRDLSTSEREFFYDILNICNDDNEFTSDDLRKEDFSSSLPHATYHRLLTRLLEKNIIAKSAGHERNKYIVTSYI